MSETFNHLCIKCRESYTDTEPDDYYCPACKEASKAIAKEVDAKLAGRPRKQPKSELQQFDELRKLRGSNFINIKDLGISL